MSARMPGPVMVAAGCGGTGRELPRLTDVTGLDVVTRTITLDAHTVPAPRRMLDSPGGLLSTSSVANSGLEHFLATELPVWVRSGVTVHVSIAGANLGQIVELARRLAIAPGVSGLELNLGEPDAGTLALVAPREPFQVAAVVAGVRREFPGDRPLLVKLGAGHERFADAALAVHDAGATAVVAGNSLAAALPDGTPAGLSGPALMPVALRSVVDARAAHPDVAVIGCGGIGTGLDAQTFLSAGAVAVQIGSALLRDPTVLDRVRGELSAAAEPSTRVPEQHAARTSTTGGTP